MKISILDFIEIFSPWIAYSGCIIRKCKYGKDRLLIVSKCLFVIISLMNTYAVYKSIIHQNNIFIYTFEHIVIQFCFIYITYLLINKRIGLFLLSLAIIFLVLFACQFRKFNPYHSIDPILSAWYSYSLIICGLIIYIFLAKGNNNIKLGYERFSSWFAASLIVYFVSIFLIYMSFDYVQYVSQEYFYLLWETTTYALLVFFILMFIAYTRIDFPKNKI